MTNPDSLSIACVLLPTILWCLICSSLRPRGLHFGWLISGMLIGMLLGGPIWLAESVVDALAGSADRYVRDFVQQVLGAACCEETLKFFAILILVWLMRGRTDQSVGRVVAISVSVGIGFMTLENVMGVIASKTPMVLAIDRQVTILAGHPSYQVVMGWCLARSIQFRSARWFAFALLAPIFLHGWGDFSEQLFRDEPNPGSMEDTILYGIWITSIVVTAIIATVLCIDTDAKIRRATR